MPHAGPLPTGASLHILVPFLDKNVPVLESILNRMVSEKIIKYDKHGISSCYVWSLIKGRYLGKSLYTPMHMLKLYPCTLECDLFARMVIMKVVTGVEAGHIGVGGPFLFHYNCCYCRNNTMWRDKHTLGKKATVKMKAETGHSEAEEQRRVQKMIRSQTKAFRIESPS